MAKVAMTELPGPQGAVTIADLFRVMSNIQVDLSKALTKLEVIDVRNSNSDEKDRDFEVRLRVLESAKAKLWGISIAIGTIAGLASGYLSSLHH